MKRNLKDKLDYILKHGAKQDVRFITRFIDSCYLRTNDPEEWQQHYDEETGVFLRSQIAVTRRELREFNKEHTAKGGAR